jgi:hypothetical protein
MTAMTEDRMNYMAFNDPGTELLTALVEQLAEQERRHIRASVVLELAAKSGRLDLFDQAQLAAVQKERMAMELQHEPLCEWIAALDPGFAARREELAKMVAEQAAENEPVAMDVEEPPEMVAKENGRKPRAEPVGKN